jgi:hypothetical protein
MQQQLQDSFVALLDQPLPSTSELTRPAVQAIDPCFIDIVFDLNPGTLQQLVALGARKAPTFVA